MLFDSWSDIIRVFFMGLLAYIALIISLRLSGKRTLAKMNVFDFVVTIALGSTLATLILSKTTSLLEGIAAFTVLIGGQYIIAWLSVRSSKFRNIIKAEPTLLVHRGHYLESALRKERITHGEVLAAVRAEGISSLDEVGGVVLETNGDMTVLKEPSGDAYDTVSIGANPDIREA